MIRHTAPSSKIVTGGIKVAQHTSQIVRMRNGIPFTDSLILATEFGRRHDNVLQSIDALIASTTLNHLDFKAVDYLDGKGELRRALELNERGALIAMPFIGGRKSREGQARLVDAFLLVRSELRRSSTIDWHVCRNNASIGFQAMSDALCDARKEIGKATCGHHYANEARLVNWILFGSFESIDRNRLSQHELHLMEAVEVRNAILIASGKPYDDRKRLLQAYYSRIHAAAGMIQ